MYNLGSTKTMFLRDLRGIRNGFLHKDYLGFFGKYVWEHTEKFSLIDNIISFILIFLSKYCRA